MKLIIEHVNDISIEEEYFRTECSTLKYLKFGIFSLAGNVRAMEIDLNKNNGLVFSMGVSMPTDIRKSAILACFYHWFTNSICNYLRLVAYLEGMSKGIKFLSDNSNKTKEQRDKYYNDYLEKMIPDVLVWRNKVTAHFAKTDPRKDDNIATLEASVMYPATFIKPYLKAGALQWHSKGESSTLPSWSLTETFEKLAPNYWPDCRLEPVINI
ncbi:MAG: hypothetical protein Q7R49_03105 [Candidatus Daviesbacteria bacterium]|nr:hypothetical protein [Candidatus Daviesbacteria bacterium]